MFQHRFQSDILVLPGKISDPKNWLLEILMFVWTFLLNSYTLQNMKETKHKKQEAKQVPAIYNMLCSNFKIK